LNDSSGNGGLVLRPHLALRQLVAPALRAARRERHIVGLVNPLQYATAMMLTMFFATLASGFLRIGFAFLAKWCCLTLAFTLDFFKECLESRVFSTVGTH
jgi:hypothetical protein